MCCTPGEITVGATDEYITSAPVDSYRVCSVIADTTFAGLARCEVTDLYGRYVFINEKRGTKFTLCNVEVHLFRECFNDVVVTITNNKYPVGSKMSN